MHLTSNDDCCSGFDIIATTTVCAAVLREALPDVELLDAATLLYLIFLSTGQHSVSLLPLHGDSRLRELTAQRDGVALLHLNILEILKKFDGPL